MKVVAAPNAFKESLTAAEAADAIAVGTRRAVPGCEVVCLPVADGGDGTREVLVRALGGQEVSGDVHDPLGRSVRAAYGRIDSGRTAVIDVAAASGLALLDSSERDPMRASSYGTGELLRRALDEGAERVWLGVGGSATVDAGMGLLAALGATWRDAGGRVLAPNGANLAAIASVDLDEATRQIGGREIIVLADVDNPLLGERGAAEVFAPQKGADAHQVELLADGLRNFAAVVARTTGREIGTVPRGGAAGGIAAGLAALVGARLVSGIDWVLDQIGFDAAVVGARLVVTGEGRLDSQSAFNKGPSGVARRARRLGVPTLVLAGAIADDFQGQHQVFDAALSIQRRPVDIAVAMRLTAGWLAFASEEVMRLVTLAAPVGGSPSTA
jgi:glycerate 2-kinase